VFLKKYLFFSKQVVIKHDKKNFKNMKNPGQHITKMTYPFTKFTK